MAKKNMNRRGFLQKGTGAAAGLALSSMSVSSRARVIGANERLRLGVIGCGGRARAVIRDMVEPAKVNTATVALCEIFKSRLETDAAKLEQRNGLRPKLYADYRKLLDDSDVDAVVIATPAHQHCGQTIDAVEAGKHVYVEKPIASVIRDLPLLNKCYDVVKASKLIVQNGSQGVSGGAGEAVREFIANKKLGKLFRAESIESSPIPYWMGYQGPKTESQTDWQAFLYNREYRPFDAHMHASWMGYHDFSSGAIGGWMSHFINFVHFTTQCGFPQTATAFGGHYSPINDPRCDAPDQVTVILEYAEGFHTHFTSHFGSSVDNETTRFMFEKGMLRSKFGHNVGVPEYSSQGVSEKMRPKKLPDVKQVNTGLCHIQNWVGCIRNGGQPNANMDFGYKQGIAILMGDLACTLGRKVHFDPKKREILPV